jgi:hypothetical protein
MLLGGMHVCDRGRRFVRAVQAVADGEAIFGPGDRGAPLVLRRQAAVAA